MRKIETKAKIRKKVQAVNPYPQVHETFFIPVRVSSDIQKRPSCFNGMVRVRRYRITIEEIDEPVEVIAARIQDLWERSNNSNHISALRDAAKKIGYELQGSWGEKR